MPHLESGVVEAFDREKEIPEHVRDLLLLVVQARILDGDGSLRREGGEEADLRVLKATQGAVVDVDESDEPSAGRTGGC